MTVPEPTLSGHLHGFCLRFDGEEVAVFPTFTGAALGLNAARCALAQLDATLAQARKEA